MNAAEFLTQLPRGVLIGVCMGLFALLGVLFGACLWFVRELYLIVKRQVEEIEHQLNGVRMELGELKDELKQTHLDLAERVSRLESDK
jgi:hypothetical protein